MKKVTLLWIVAVSVTGCGLDFALPSDGTQDITAPVLSGFSASSQYVRASEIVTLFFESSESLPETDADGGPNPRVELAGSPMSCGAEGTGYFCTLVATTEHAEGLHSFGLRAVDAVGNETNFTLQSPSVVFDFTAPRIVVSTAPEPIARGEEILISVFASENLGLTPAFFGTAFQGTPVCIGALPGNDIRCTVTIAADTPPGVVDFTVDVVDLAGNPGQAVHELTVTEPLPIIGQPTVSPDPATDGDVLTIVIPYSGGVNECRARVGASAATCAAPTGTDCSCTLNILPEFPEGPARIDLELVGTGGTTTGVVNAHIDRTRPVVVDRQKLIYARTPVGVVDTVRGEPGAVADEGPIYPGQQVAWIEFYDGPSLTTLYGEGPVDADGGFAPIELGDQNTTTLVARVRDQAGLESLGTYEVKTIEATLDLTGETRFGTKKPKVRLWPVTGVVDPTAGSPGLSLAEAPVPPSADLTSADGTGATTTATARLAEATAWQLDAFPTGTYVRMTRVPQRQVVVAVASPGGGGALETWEYDGATWTRIDTTTRIGARQDYAIACDESTGQVFLSGGQTDTGTGFDDTWAFDGANWVKQSGTIVFGGRIHHQMIWVPTSQQLVLFGGSATNGNLNSDFEYWTGTTWSGMSYSSSLRRSEYGMVWDPVNGRLVLFGGWEDSPSPGVKNDTWVASYTTTWTWTQLTPATVPPARRRPVMVWDSTRNKIVMHGGYDGATEYTDTWTFDGTDWTEETPTGAPGSRAHAGAADGAGNLVTLHLRPAVDGPNLDLWQLSGAAGSMAWSNLITRPTGYLMSAATWDARYQRVLVYGGQDRTTGQQSGEQWVRENGRWRQLPLVSTPAFRWGAGLAYHGRIGKVFMVGGENATGSPPAKTYTLDDSTWIELPGGTGVLPYRVRLTAMAYDPVRDRLVLFGGMDNNAFLMNATWEYDGSVWARIEPTTTNPSPRVLHGLVYDPLRGRVVLHGGYINGGGELYSVDDTFEWDGLDWTPSPQATPPSVGGSGRLAWHPGLDEVVLFGGDDYQGGGPTVDTTVDLTWSWDGTGLTDLSLTPAPAGRLFSVMVGDPVVGDVVLLGGQDFSVQNRTVSTLGGATAASRRAAHLVSVETFDNVTVTSAGIHWVGHGTGSSGAGIELLAWNDATESWVSLGSHTAASTGTEAERTLDFDVTGTAADYVVNGNVYFLLVAPASSATPGTDSTLTTDDFEARVTWAY